MTFFNINHCWTMFDLIESILFTAVIKKQRNMDNATLYQGKNGNKCYCNAKYL